MKQMKLEDVPFGKNFKVWGHTYTVLDGDDSGVFVLETDAVCKMPFRKKGIGYRIAPNDFRDSSINVFLDVDYLEELIEEGADLNRDIIETGLILKCTLGQLEYDVAWGYAGLLTLEQYGKYYDIIPKIDAPYWLATPWKTPSRAPGNGATYGVWVVNSDGYCNCWSCHYTYGVRPALTLSSSLLVSVECDP